MKALKTLTPWFAALAIGGTVALAPIAGAATTTAAPAAVTTSVVAAAGPNNGGSDPDPLVPYGTDPKPQTHLGYINPNHDEGNTSNGEVDAPF